MQNQPTEIKEFDLRGQICPSTLLTALREINGAKQQLKEAALGLVFLTDNRSSTMHISETAGNMGYKVKVEKMEGFYRVVVSGNA